MTAAVLAVLSLPSLVGALPVSDAASVTAADVLKRIRASGSVGYSGYAESRGGLAFPDVRELGDLPALFGGTTRMRVWWGGRDRWRVDTLRTAGEDDAYQDPAGTWAWDSGPREATRVNGAFPVRLPRAADLLPAELGRRLAAAATPGEASRLPARRIAGHTGLGVRLTPADPEVTLGHVDVWSDRATGLPLRVALTARGASAPILQSSFLELHLAAPPPDTTRFTPPSDAGVVQAEAPDIAATIDRLAPYTPPADLVGLPRRERVRGLAGLGDQPGGGAATYGEGFTLVVVLPLPTGVARSFQRRLSGSPAVPVMLDGADAVAVPTPLVNALVVATGRRAYLLAGTVSQSFLERAAALLVAAPPPRRAPR